MIPAIVITITVLLLIFTVVFSVMIKRYTKPENANYWRKALIVAVLGALILVFISFTNRYLYLFAVILLFFLSAFKFPKALKSVNGYIVAGLYFSFWLSLPLSLYFAFKK